MSEKLTVDVINNLIGVNESYKASDKLMGIMLNKEERDNVFRSFLEIEEDLSFDWFTEYFQAEHSDRKGKKQDFTPDGIIQVASGVLGKTISNADICAGTGGLTIKRYSENKDASFYCEEFSDRAMPFLLFNLAIRNVDAIVCHGDSLTREFKAIYKLSRSSEFSEIELIDDLPIVKNQTVIMNPPYSMPWDAKKERLDEDRFKDYGALAPKSKSDYAFLLQGLHSLEENGTMSIILPHGVLFRGSSEEKIRTKLIELNYLDAVIGLPAKAFIATDIPTVLLVFKKNRQNNDVLFIDASKECVKRGPNNVLEGQHVNKILETFKNRSDLDKFSKKIYLSEIQENGYNLNIPRYIDTFEPEEVIPLGETLAELKQIDSEIRISELNLASMLDELVSNDIAGQKEIDDMVDYFYSKNNVFPKKEKHKRGEVEFIMIDFTTYEEVKLEDVAEFGRAKTGHIYPAGASFIQVSASRGQVGYLYQKGEIESKNVVIIPQTGIDKFYFNIILKKNIDKFMCKYATGINVQEKEIGNFPIQLHSFKTQREIARVVKEMDKRCNEQENEIMKLNELKKTLLSEMFI